MCNLEPYYKLQYVAAAIENILYSIVFKTYLSLSPLYVGTIYNNNS